jgi:phosphoglycolate phosphatase
MSRPLAPGRPAAVLFDLDGTLLDTARDMVHALNVICAEEGAAPVGYDQARGQVSNGAVGLLRLAFPEFDPTRDTALHRRYLERYGKRLAVETRLFPGLDGLLEDLDRAEVPWGIVTNKPRHLTEPLLAALGLHRRAACTVSGDTLPERKPHPRPLLFALEQLAADPAKSVYVGDARRDIEAGRAAGTVTVAVRYGYVEPGQEPATWGADYVVDTTLDLIALLNGER